MVLAITDDGWETPRGKGGIYAGMVQKYNGDSGEGIMEIFGKEGKVYIIRITNKQ